MQEKTATYQLRRRGSAKTIRFIRACSRNISQEKVSSERLPLWSCNALCTQDLPLPGWPRRTNIAHRGLALAAKGVRLHVPAKKPRLSKTDLPLRASREDFLLNGGQVLPRVCEGLESPDNEMHRSGPTAGCAPPPHLEAPAAPAAVQVPPRAAVRHRCVPGLTAAGRAPECCEGICPSTPESARIAANATCTKQAQTKHVLCVAKPPWLPRAEKCLRSAAVAPSL